MKEMMDWRLPMYYQTAIKKYGGSVVMGTSGKQEFKVEIEEVDAHIVQGEKSNNT